MGEVNGVKGAWGYVKGGMGQLSTVIAESAQEAGAEIVVNADGCHQVNSTRRQAATLLLCPKRSTKRPRALPKPSAMLERVPRALPVRLETMLATPPRVLLVT